MFSLKSNNRRLKLYLFIVSSILLNTLFLQAQPGIGISFRFQTAATTTAFPTAGATSQVVPLANQDNFGYLFSPAGMNVKFGNNYYQKFVVSTNGWIALVPASVAAIPATLSAGNYLNTNSLSTYAGGYPILAPFWDNIAATGITYNYVGNALWVRWSAKIDNNNPTAAFLFWLKIDGPSGDISYYYTATPYVINGTPSASIGVAGVCTGDYYSYNYNAALTYADSTVETTTNASKPIGVTYSFLPYQLYDNCSNAKNISPLTSSCNFTTYNINNATTSGSSLTCSPSTTDTADIWFSVTKPPGVLNLTVTTAPASGCQAVAGTTIEVFTSCGGASLGCSSTSTGNPGFGELALTRPCNSETLFIRVTSDNDIGGKFQLCVNSTSTINGISCATAVPICAPIPFHSSGHTTQGSVDDYRNNVLCQSEYLTGEDFVFTYTPSITQCVTISIDGTGPNSYPGLFVLDGCPNDTDFSVCVASAMNVSNGDTISNLTLSAGETYYIVVDNNNILGGNSFINFNIHIVPSATSAPPNDNCASALPLPAVSSTATCSWIGPYSTQCSNPSPTTGYPNPGCGGFTDLTNDVWFSFTANYSGVLQINSQGFGANPVIHGGLAVYQGACGALTLVACAGDSVAIPFMPSLTFAVTNGGNYLIRFWSATGYDPGSFRLCFVANCNLPNDLPTAAIAIPLGVPTMGDNTCSTGAGEMPTPINCAVSSPVNTVWFSIVAPPSGQVAVRISQISLLNAEVAAFLFPTGPANAPTSFTRLACNDDIIFAPPCPQCGLGADNDAAITFTTTPGNTVYLAVDGEFSYVGTFWITAIEGNLTSIFPPLLKKDCNNPEIVCSNTNYFVPNGGIGSYGNNCDFTGLTCTGGPITGECGATWIQFQVVPGSPLGFTITSTDSATPAANYNFYLWDITGLTLSNVCNALTTTPRIRCNSAAGTARTGCRNPPTANYADIVPAQATLRTYLLYIQNLTSANDDDGVPGSYNGFVLNWDIYQGGINIGKTQLSGSSDICNWSGAVVDTNYQNINNWKGLAACPAPVPSCTTDVFISAATKECWVTTVSYARDITINPGGTLRLKPGSNLHVCGNFVNNGTLICEPTSTITFDGGNALQTISGVLVGPNSFANIVITKSGSQVTLLNNLDVTENFTTSNNTSVFNINGKYMKVGRNFSNFNGTITFTGIGLGIGSTVEFYGTTNGTFTNLNGTINLNDVKMNKTGGKLYLTGINSRMNIDSTLTMTSGIIVTRSLPSLEVNMKYYMPSALSGHNPSSYIDGKLRRKIANGLFSTPPIPASYDFPLGDSTIAPTGYQLANITFTQATLVFDLLGTFNRWNAGPPAQGPVASECVVATYSNLPVFDNGYWTFKRSTSNFTGRYTVSLYNTGVTNNTGLGWTVAKADTLSNPNLITSWGLTGNCVLTSTAANTQRSNINPSPYADSLSFNHHYATVQTELVLPIKLLSFTGEPKGNDVICNWETASETNNEYFDLERSLDGENFELIERIAGYGLGISTEIRSYSVIDKDICNGIVYYRLKQVDIDGAYSYSEVIAVNCTDLKSGIKAYPNPAHESVSISFYEPADGYVQIRFIDFTGRTVYSTDVYAVKGFNRVPVTLDQLSDGVYTIDLGSLNISAQPARQARFIKR